MAVQTFEGIVEAGQIRLLSGEQLPEQATVYIVVPNYKEPEESLYTVSLSQNPRIASPRLASKDDAARFALEMTDDVHAGI